MFAISKTWQTWLFSLFAHRKRPTLAPMSTSAYKAAPGAETLTALTALHGEVQQVRRVQGEHSTALTALHGEVQQVKRVQGEHSTALTTLHGEVQQVKRVQDEHSQVLVYHTRILEALVATQAEQRKMLETMNEGQLTLLARTNVIATKLGIDLT
jgi:NAD+--asparagine ADP-ribosyltransferase